MSKKAKAKNPDKIGFGKFIAWNSRSVSLAVQVVLIGYVQIYCTNALGLNAAVVGTLLMLTKLLDGVTDVVAGYIVDRTNTKIGRGRPYEIAIIGLWFCTWMMFAVPEGLTDVVKCVWVVVCYSLAQSVCATLLNACQTVYMVRAFHNEKKYITLSSLGGLIITFGVIVFNVVFPIFEAQIVNSPSGWRNLVACFAIPLGIIGIMRFIFVKEEAEIDADSEKISFKDIITLLKTNKYVYCVAFMLFVSNCIGSMGVATYYYLYIVQDLAIMGFMSLFTVISMLTMAVYPALLKKMSKSKLVSIGCVLVIIGGIITFIAKDNLLLLGISGIIHGVGILPISYLNGLFIIDCADYNEWKERPRMEGTLGSVTGLATKIGTAFGSFLLGIMLSAANFDGTAEMIADSAALMIRVLQGLAPAFFYFLIMVILRFYKLDAMKPQIIKELEDRKAVAE